MTKGRLLYSKDEEFRVAYETRTRKRYFDFRPVLTMMRELQAAIECCIDVVNHIIVHQGFRAPESYADSFTVLAENRVIEQDFVSTAHKMVRMGNRLVHPLTK